MALTITSPAFQSGRGIPAACTCDGEDVSPPLRWSGAPAGTQSFALIVEDPDAPRGTWTHWVVYNIPSDEQELPEHLPAREQLPNGTRQGLTDFRCVGYGGPCPPSGTHRYVFTLYALGVMLPVAPAATKAQLRKAMAGHSLAHAELIGTYQRLR